MVTKAALRKKTLRDFMIILGSIILGIVFAKTNVLIPLLTATQGTIVISSIIAGAAFVSLFTAAPAAVILVELILANTFVDVVLWATVGAVLSDLMIFRFFEHSLLLDTQRWAHRRFLPLIGATIVASPLPDELGIALMGFSHLSTKKFLFLSAVLNFLGIAALGLVALGFQ